LEHGVLMLCREDGATRLKYRFREKLRCRLIPM
jgi:hypothetical protein